MPVTIKESWKQQLSQEFRQPYFSALIHFVKKEYAENTCYPQGSDIFAAFEHCPFDSTKVVLIGQDPYHGPDQANGLCFSVKDGIAHPPSLINIFKELENDVGKSYPKSGDLEHWARQGVLLLNATLTVRARNAGSHQKKGWEAFTDAVIRKLSDEKGGLVFLLWGGYAKKKAALIDEEKHYILTSGHPSPLSANRGYWFGNGHFSQTNEILKKIGKRPIEW
ncbi:uracil-DNA glycosylase [Pricia sp. S334]|uniref:Uracil-DNA glycosylase n=1 Tax=Pricia mediterranea TaxID=3076079 RepID=A0ABU3LAZ7_9FLAO|nr:uracil-DNA glycosylase [Pricia sp. S334]MDT7830578.1 uracil-DNA glycosylase [Pricia sp. S334]